MFYLRRALYVLILIFFKDYPLIKIIMHTELSVAYLIYLGQRPFATKFQNRLELFNEACVMLCTYWYLSFLNMEYSPEVKHQYGNVFIVIIAFNIVINFGGIIRESAGDFPKFIEKL